MLQKRMSAHGCVNPKTDFQCYEEQLYHIIYSVN